MKGCSVKTGNALCISTLFVVTELNSGLIDKVYSRPKRLAPCQNPRMIDLILIRSLDGDEE